MNKKGKKKPLWSNKGEQTKKRHQIKKSKHTQKKKQKKFLQFSFFALHLQVSLQMDCIYHLYISGLGSPLVIWAPPGALIALALILH